MFLWHIFCNWPHGHVELFSELTYINHISPIKRKPTFFISEKDADQLCSKCQLISTFVFASQTVQSLFFLNLKLKASSLLLLLYNPSCVWPHLKPIKQAFLRHGLYEPWREKTGLQGFRPGLTQTGLYSHKSRLEAWNFRKKKKRNYTIHVVKTKALISFAVTAKLICVFVFA